jgi:glycine oxidase
MSAAAPLHIGIAGAGLAGRLLAWRLLRADCRVTLFDAQRRSNNASASMVAAAMLSPLAELAVADDIVFALGRQSMALWPTWIGEMAEGGAAPVYFRQEGTLVVAHAPDQTSLDHFSRLLHHKLPPESRNQVHVLDAAELAHREPALAGRFRGGLYLEGEGQLANDQLMVALAFEIDRLGGIWYESTAVHHVKAGQIVCENALHTVDIAVDTRGLGSKAALPPGHALRGVRGEVLRVQCSGIRLQRPVRLMHPRYQLYVAPRPNDAFVVGATELESEDGGPVTVRSVLELASALHSLHPAFGEARVLHMSAALRPAFDDHRPVVFERDGVWHLNGLYRHGYLCAPALVGSLVQALMQHAPATALP